MTLEGGGGGGGDSILDNLDPMGELYEKVSEETEDFDPLMSAVSGMHASAHNTIEQHVKNDLTMSPFSPLAEEGYGELSWDNFKDHFNANYALGEKNNYDTIYQSFEPAGEEFATDAADTIAPIAAAIAPYVVDYFVPGLGSAIGAGIGVAKGVHTAVNAENTGDAVAGIAGAIGGYGKLTGASTLTDAANTVGHAYRTGKAIENEDWINAAVGLYNTADAATDTYNSATGGTSPSGGLTEAGGETNMSESSDNWWKDTLQTVGEYTNSDAGKTAKLANSLYNTYERYTDQKEALEDWENRAIQQMMYPTGGATSMPLYDLANSGYNQNPSTAYTGGLGQIAQARDPMSFLGQGNQRKLKQYGA